MVDSLGKVSFVLVFLCLFLTLSLVGSSILGLVIDSSDDILFNNRTEASEVGGRLKASIFFMNFNENIEPGGYVIDGSVYNNFGNNSGATWNSSCGVTDAGNDLGGCFEFDGSGDFIGIADDNSLTFTSFTISVWAKTSIETGGLQTILCNYDTDSEWICIRLENDGDMNFAIDDGSNPLGLLVTSGVDYIDGSWHNYIFVRN